MMDKFSKGEVVIIQSKSHPEFNGQETEVLEILKRPSGGYRCSIEPKGTMLQNGWAESALRKKKPPEEPATWQEIQELTNWNPAKEAIHE